MRRERGRRFDSFTWKKDGMERTVEIRAVGTGAHVEFFAEDIDLSIRVASKVAAEIPDLLTKEFEKRFETKWDPYIWVGVANLGSQETSYHRQAALGWEPIAIGKNANGDTLHCEASFDIDHGDWDDGIRQGPARWDGKWHPMARTIRKGKPEEPHDLVVDNHYGDGRTVFERGKPVVSLLPATIENVNAILQFEWTLRCLAWKIKKHFEPDRIQETLRALNQGQGLPMLTEGGR